MVNDDRPKSKRIREPESCEDCLEPATYSATNDHGDRYVACSKHARWYLTKGFIVLPFDRS